MLPRLGACSMPPQQRPVRRVKSLPPRIRSNCRVPVRLVTATGGKKQKKRDALQASSLELCHYDLVDACVFVSSK